MTRAELAEAAQAVAPLAPAGLLVAFPSLDFHGRTSLRIQECAERVQISWSHLVDLIHEDGVSKMDLTLSPTPSRAALRISLSGWRRWVATRWMATNGELPPSKPISRADCLAEHPDLCPDFGTSVLTLKAVASIWGCSYQHLSNLWVDPLTRRFGLLDLASQGSTKAVWRMPVEEYFRATLAGMAAGERYQPTPRDGTPRTGRGADLPGQQHLFAAHG